MKLIERNGLRILVPSLGHYLKHKETGDIITGKIYLGKFASQDEYEEVFNTSCDESVKLAIEEIEKKENATEEVVRSITDEELPALIEENMVQNEALDTTMLALDEMFILFEPILMSTMSVLSVNEREVRNPMVELYVVMIQRGLKTIDQVPARYREEVKAILDAVEK